MVFGHLLLAFNPIIAFKTLLSTTPLPQFMIYC